MHAVDHWKTLVTLAPGEQLNHEGSRSAGFMAEEDVDSYAVVGADGVTTGRVVVRDHTAVKGFRRTIHVTHRDASGKMVLDTAYDVRR